MARTGFQSVDEYIASLPPHTQTTLRRVRATIRKALPPAEEGISYQIPVYKVNGKVALYFAGYENHYSIYPASAPLVRALKDVKARIHNKATIRFSYDEKMPAALIARIAKFRAAEAGQPVVVARKTRASSRKRAAKKKL
jgi:uncharacterized protein YdhG (YjbR/CyaY superfamily)